MSVNLYRNREQLLAAYKQVTDDNHPNEWALYGYVRDSNDLEVVETGKGMDNLMDEFDSCKIQYAFLRVVDPKSGLYKFVFINWQGEGAALSRKGICANHVKDVHGFFRGAHITINARNEEEVEPEVILEKVARASATQINLKDRSDVIENTGPVGTNYQRVQPAREINSSERESFWTKQQEEERRRKIEERKRVEEERKRVEEEERKRELKQAQMREVIVAKKEEEIAKRREQEKNAENRARDVLETRCTNGHQLEEDPDEERTKRAEDLRKARAQEAKTLISGSKIKDARALFEKNSSGPVGPPPAVAKKNANLTNHSNGKVAKIYTANIVKKSEETSSPVTPETVKPTNGSVSPTVNSSNHVLNAKKMFETPPDTNGTSKPSSLVKVEELKPAVAPVTQKSPIAPDVRTPSPQIEDEPRPQEPEPREEFFEEEEEDDYIVHQEVEQPVRRLSAYDLPEHTLEDIQEEPEELVEEDGSQPVFPHMIGEKSDLGITARALYDYQAADETEISFDPDDIITHIDKIDPGWYQGMAPNGTYGLFPSNYVEILEE